MSKEEAIKNIKKQIENLKKANKCGLATKNEFNEDIESLETVLQLLEQKENIIKELEDETYKMSEYMKEIATRRNNAIDKLKEHKKDLDYEPWSFYKIDGSILFDLVKILEE